MVKGDKPPPPVQSGSPVVINQFILAYLAFVIFISVLLLCLCRATTRSNRVLRIAIVQTKININHTLFRILQPNLPLPWPNRPPQPPLAIYDILCVFGVKYVSGWLVLQQNHWTHWGNFLSLVLRHFNTPNGYALYMYTTILDYICHFPHFCKSPWSQNFSFYSRGGLCIERLCQLISMAIVPPTCVHTKQDRLYRVLVFH